MYLTIGNCHSESVCHLASNYKGIIYPGSTSGRDLAFSAIAGLLVDIKIAHSVGDQDCNVPRIIPYTVGLTVYEHEF